MKRLNLVMLSTALTAVLLALSLPAPGQAQQADQPSIDIERDGGLLMIISPLWLRYESWRFGKLDRRNYFLIVKPLAKCNHELSWRAWVGPAGGMKEIKLIREPQKLPNGTYAVPTESKLFVFPLGKRSNKATYGGKRMARPNIEFGPATALRPGQAPPSPEGPCPKLLPTSSQLGMLPPITDRGTNQ